MMLDKCWTKRLALRLDDGARQVYGPCGEGQPRRHARGGGAASVITLWFSNSLTRFVLLFGGIPRQRLMGAYLIVIEQILLQFVLKRR